MYLDHFHLSQSPFQEEPDPEIFFPGAKREEICQSLILDILAGKPLIKLIGPEGTGKTLLCRVILDRLPVKYKVVYIDNPVGAFDDLLRIACLDLGMNPLGGHDSVNFSQEFRRLLEAQRAENTKIVLIIDEAEKLFLATLERLIRSVCDTEEDLGLTIVLCGRLGLDANLEQLSLFCANIDINAGYYLDNLTENETRQYLRFRLNAAGLSREQHEEIFTEDAVSKIFDAAQGNVRMINIRAEESLQVSCSEKSFMVLLDHVEPEPEEKASEQVGNRVIEIYELLRHNRFLVSALAGAVALVLAIGFMLSGDDGKEPQPAAITEKAPAAISQPLQNTPQFALTDNSVDKPVPEEEPSSRGVLSMPEAQEKNVQQSTPDRKDVQPHLALEKTSRDGDQLFRERLGASASWLAGVYRGGYTVQLMMLVSNQAQESISRMLTKDGYYQLRENLYILRKNTTPPTLFVFYGKYDSMEDARDARNTMPVFLRDHHPYPLLISEALKKVER
jgi:type II secretory pathway predicted ATPase ExeA